MFISIRFGFILIFYPMDYKNPSPQMQSVDEATSTSVQTSPWELSSQAEDSFFPNQKIDATRYNGLYPYRLIVLDMSTGKPVGGGKIKVKAQNKYENFINQELNPSSWIFSLPITPQMISIQDNYAINTSATMRGVVEEHNGVKFKTISIQGTTGIWAKRQSRDSKLAPKPLGGFFAGTIESFNNLKSTANRVVNAATGSHPNLPAKTDKFKPNLQDTGFFQAQYLAQFLERYAMEKKNPKNSSWRLVLDIPKENQSFIVTPVTFNLSKSQQKPNEYQFQMVLKAWKRIDLNAPIQEANVRLPSLTPDLLQKINSTIRETRRTLGAAQNLVQAVRSDFQAPLNALRQTQLAIKDLSGLVVSIIDLPKQVISDLKSAIATAQSIFSDSFSDFGERQTLKGASTPQDRAAYAVKIFKSRFNQNEGLSIDQVNNKAIGQNQSDLNDLDPINEIFNDPDLYFDFFNNISVDQLNLTPEQRNVIEDIQLNASLTTIDDFRSYKKELQDLADAISNNFGTLDPVYAQIYNKGQPRERITEMTLEEMEILQSIYNSIQAYDLLIQNKSYDDLKIESPLQFVGGYANSVGIQFNNYTSKYLAPVPFGLTIEEIAARYLGSPDRYLEIVTLNGLRSPYIDETGFNQNLLSNAEGRRFVVEDTKRFYIGQKIILSSLTVNPISKKITNIEQVGTTAIVITVDGEADLSSLTIADGAKVQAYLPATVNSQNQIYIPSNNPAEVDDRVFTITHLEEDKLTRLSKVDFLLTESGDLAINSVGDLRLANGLTNLIQALKLKVITRKGSIIRHPDFGLGLVVGASLADIESGQVAQELNDLVTADPRFAGIESLQVKLANGTLNISMSVKIAGGTGYIPISFDVKV